MIEYLTSKDVAPAPKREPTTPRESGVAYGTVTPSFERGALYLVSGERSMRLVWSGDRASIAVPVGTWHLRNYKVERTREGVEWLLSGTAAPGPKIEVREGVDTKLAIEEIVRVSLQVKREKGAFQLGFEVTGHAGMGLSVVKAEARPVPTWKILSGGTTIARGEYRYG